MSRVLLAGLLLLMLGCTVPAERVPLRPLPENGQVLPYRDLLSRVRAQANGATDAFYLDHWNELEDMAKGMEQTSRFLSKAEEVPEKDRKILKEMTDELSKNAAKLRNAAAAHNAKDAQDALQRIISRVRELSLTDEGSVPPKEAAPPKAK